MPIAELIAALERDATQQAVDIIAQARTKADTVIAAARAEIEAAQAAELAARERLVRARTAAELAQLRQKTRAGWLQARQAVLERIVAHARTILADVNEQSDYQEHVRAQLNGALQYVPAKSLVFCAPALESILQPLVAQHPELTLHASPEMSSGFCLRAQDGSVAVTCTLEVDLVRRGAELAVALAHELE
jgi:vacuolar-type H+-ATPase subunit E/Vma4